MTNASSSAGFDESLFSLEGKLAVVASPAKGSASHHHLSSSERDTPMDVLSALSAARLVPVVVLDDAADADALAGALVAGGLPVAEVTFRTAAAPDSIRVMAARGDILVGAGTVLTPAQVDQAVAAGDQFQGKLDNIFVRLL